MADAILLTMERKLFAAIRAWSLELDHAAPHPETLEEIEGDERQFFTVMARAALTAIPSDDGLIKALTYIAETSDDEHISRKAFEALSRHKAPLSALQVTEGDKVGQCILDALHERLPYPAEACAIVRSVLHSKQEGEG